MEIRACLEPAVIEDRDTSQYVNVNALKMVDQFLGRKSWKLKENSNMSYSLQGLNNHLSSELSTLYWLYSIYPSGIRDAHLSGDMHLHDLSILGAYCVGWDLQSLLMEGFRGASGKVESLPARHFRSALGQTVNFLYTLQGETAGAQAFSSFDTLLAPFIRHDRLTFDEVKQAMQEFLFNVNIPTRVGFQTPFTNITLDLKVPRHLEHMPAIVGGKPCGDCYGDFRDEMNLFNRAFLEVMRDGDARGRVFTFPIPTYNITESFDWDDSSYDILWEITAKYGVPYFANFINSDMSPEEATSMCCRLRIDNRKLYRKGGGLFGASPLTGSIGVVTLNMPRIGHQQSTERGYFQRLQYLMELASESLEIKRGKLEELADGGLYPYASFYLKSIRERFGYYWKNHFSTIGIVGMNESCRNFLGEDIGSERGREFTLKVLDYMNRALIRFQQQTGNSYNLEATPAEGTSYRLARLDHEQCRTAYFSDTAGVREGKAPFYTNSTQLPVMYTDDAFRILELQDEIQSRYTGGTVQHFYLGERVHDPGAVKRFIRRAFTCFKLPYLSITPTFSVCPHCGYMDGEKEVCPCCGSACEVYSRITGYLRPVSEWNEGKQQEFMARRKVTL